MPKIKKFKNLDPNQIYISPVKINKKSVSLEFPIELLKYFNIDKQKVFDKFWFEKHQNKLLWFANSWIGKQFFQFKKTISRCRVYSTVPHTEGFALFSF